MATKKSKGSSAAAMGSCYPAPLTAEQKKQHERWEAEEDLRTLVRAADIRKDPRRMARAKAMAQEQIKAAQAKAASLT